jgi:hypothetical protein
MIRSAATISRKGRDRTIVGLSSWRTLSRPTAASEHSHAKSTATEGPWLGEHALLVQKRNTNVKLVEPPSCSPASTIVFIGRNRRGNWVAQEQNGLYGGLFINRAQAVKYALFENGHHPETIVELSREIELDMGGKLPFPAPAPGGTL